MKMKSLILLSSLCFFLTPSWACTSTKLIAKDHSVVYGRTLEFGIDVHSNVIFIPRAYALQATSPIEGKNALQWKTKYAVLGANAEGQKLIIDGINEKGLAAGVFYFPGYEQYQSVNEANVSQSLNSVELVTYLLSQSKNIDEVKQALHSIRVNKAVFKPWGFLVPVHYLVTEPSGKSLVIEYIDGKLKLYDAPLGVITNAPTFDWQMTNLRSYVNLSPLNVSEVKVNNKTLKHFGQGSGMHGLPGDFTPPSRFVRSAIFTASSLPVPDAKQAVLQVFHILNNFDIPKGAVRDKTNGQLHTDTTLWTSASDLKHLLFYFHTYNDRAIKRVDLKAFDWNAKGIAVVSMQGQNQIQDLAPQAKPWKTKP